MLLTPRRAEVRGTLRIPAQTRYSSAVALAKTQEAETYNFERNLACKNGLRLSRCSRMNLDIRAALATSLGSGRGYGNWERLAELLKTLADHWLKEREHGHR